MTTPRRVAVVHGDARLVLPALPEDPIGAVVTDPPYVFWRHICATDDLEQVDLQAEAQFMIDHFAWTLPWFAEVRRRVPGVLWLFTEPHFLGTYVRIARYLRWPLAGWWRALEDESEYLVAFADLWRLGSATAPVQAALALNRYGGGKPVEMLRILIALSPPGAVLDPFCGTGSTLEAGLHEGRDAIGIEHDGPTHVACVARMRAIGRVAETPQDGDAA